MNFAEPLNDVVWRRVVREAESRANACGLTARSQARTGFQIMVGPGPLVGNVPPPPQLDVDAIRFYRSATEEDTSRLLPAETVTISKGALIYHTMAYTRWEVVSAQLNSMLTVPLGIALEAVLVANVRLEYKDVFKHAIDDSAPLADSLLRPGCDLIAPHVYHRRQLFHSHTGFFEECHGCDQRLVQLNVDANDLADQTGQIRTISITTAVQDNFFPDLEAERTRTATELISKFDSIHARSGDLFRSVVTDEIAERVGMPT